MGSEQLRAAFTATETITKVLNKVNVSFENLESTVQDVSRGMQGNAISTESLEESQQSLARTTAGASQSFEKLNNSLQSNSINSSAVAASHRNAARAADNYSDQIDQAKRSFESLSVVQGMSTAQAATNAGAMQIAGNVIDDMGNDALKTAGQMGVLNTVMQELSLSGSALSVNIGAFNVSLRNLAPLVPIAASMGSVVAVAGAMVSSLGAMTVAFAGFTAGGAVGFLEDIEENIEGVTNQAEALQTLMRGMGELFKEAIAPLNTIANEDFFVNVIEGLADLVNRLSQAIEQTRDVFMPLFTGMNDILNREFDAIANGIEDMMEIMDPVLINFFEWFMVKLPDALRFMAHATRDLAGPIGNLGNSLLDVLTSIIDTATAVIQGLAPAFAVAIDTATALIDIFNVLSNGVLQAGLAIGGLSIAAAKFVDIADTMANIGISAANTIIQFGKHMQSVTGITGALSSALSEQFKHLNALGSVLQRNMTVEQASGQVQRDLADAVKEYAEALMAAELNAEQLRNKLITLNTVLESDAPLKDQTEEIEEFRDEMEKTSKSADKNLSNVADSIEDVTDVPSEKLKGGAKSVDISGIADVDPDFEKSEAGKAITDKIESGREEISDATKSASRKHVDIAAMDPGISTDEIMRDAENKTADVVTTVNNANEKIADAVSGPDDLRMDPKLISTTRTFGEVGDSASEAAEAVSKSSDNIVEGIDGITKSGESLYFFDETGFANHIDESEELKKALGDIDFDKIDTSDIEAENVTELRNELIKADDELIGLGGTIRRGPLSAGPMEPMITDESGQAVEALGRSLDDAGESAMDMGTSLENMSDVGAGIAIPPGPDVASRQAAEAAERVEDSFESMDVAEGFDFIDPDDTNLDIIRNKIGNTTGVIGTQLGKLKLIATNVFSGIGSAFLSFSEIAADQAKSVLNGLKIIGGGMKELAIIAKTRLATSINGATFSLSALKASLLGTLASLKLTLINALATAAGFIGGLVPASLTAGAALNIAFAGIPALLAGIAVAAGAVVGILANMDSITSGLKGSLGAVKSGIGAIGDALLTMAVPAWNLMVDIFEAIMAPIFALRDGFMLIAESLGMASGEGSMLSSILGLLMDGFSALMAGMGALFDFVAPAFSLIGDVLYVSIIVPFQILAGIINRVTDLAVGLSNAFIDNVPYAAETVEFLNELLEGMQEFLTAIPDAVRGAVEIAADAIDELISDVMSMLEGALDLVNGVIRRANMIEGVNIEEVGTGALGGTASDAFADQQTTMAEVRENARRGEEEAGEDVATEPDVNLSLEESVENNVEVEADPEDKAQLSRITKDAIEEANSFARRQQGGQ